MTTLEAATIGAAVTEAAAALLAGPPVTLVMPAGLELLTANDRPPHWSVRMRVYRDLRGMAKIMAIRQRLPRVGRCLVWVEYQPAGRGKRVKDAGNIAPSGKPCIDGLRDAGVLEDDTAGWVPAEMYRIGPCHRPSGRLLVHLFPTQGFTLDLPNPAVRG